jgi:Concanavalin A-like lectin/glucanases superfamily
VNIKQPGSLGTDDRGGFVGAIPVCIGPGWGVMEAGSAGMAVGSYNGAVGWTYPGNLIANTKYVLQFTPQVTGANAAPMQVYHGGFWPASTNLTGGFYWDYWVCPALTYAANTAAYVISDGYGGAHALLTGFEQSNNPLTLQTFTGNIYTGSNTVSYYGDDGLYAGEWGHIAIIWDGANYIYVYVDGIPCGKNTFTGPRQSPTVTTGGGNDLNIGGSTHSNFTGSIACIRGFEGTPLLYFGTPGEYAIGQCWPFNPWLWTGTTWTACNFLADYTVPGRTLIPDLSPLGYVDGSGSSRFHPGFLYGSAAPRGASASSYPIPIYVNDPTFPFFTNGTIQAPTAGVSTPAKPPIGAKVFDSFSRPNSTWAFANPPTLGSTESGLLGPLAWNSGSVASGASGTAYWGILHGAAVNCATTNNAGFPTAWVNVGTDTQDIRVSRILGSYGVGARTGICGRLVDDLDYWYVGANNPSNTVTSQQITVISFTAGSPTQQAQVTAPATSWKVLRAVFSGTTLTVYCDGTQVSQLTGIAGPDGTNAGIAGHNGDGQAAMSGLDRWNDFTVF